ncbi:neutral alpha-glucosidase C [Tribolium castaneum]|uniref:Glucosidase II subunit alpha n=1 Tax=Tribolium castaneum TaxID=7070 RepID=A0A139WAP0_TRICA|nr:PREDICTED: neutral alpha-glucosidase C [Tribolium castaneum]KYB24988.1 Neutral alpha-glucosidase AB-like Protein [Tribolium castaneum]|eukprot:XP_015839609.1 PREDICTED: neutral alpha-glucosidase C [Tribolium castaneum]
MMFKSLFFVITLVVTQSLAADHNTFKDCSRVDFCTNLRTRQPSNDYSVDPDTITTNANTLSATLRPNSGGTDLVLTLTGLQEDTFRVKIKEVDSGRYELVDVLDGEPKPTDFNGVARDDTSITVSTNSNSNSARVTFSPFSIEFSKDGLLEVVFDGDKLTLLETEVNAPFSFGVKFPQAVQLYGIHEHCETLALKNTAPGGTDPYRLKNSDVGGFEIESPMALYGSIPVLYGHGPKATSGVFLHNAAQQWVETTSSSAGTTQAYFMTEAGCLDLFVLLGPTPTQVVRQYTQLTGTAHLPQIWVLGYHQSRYSYDTQELVKDVAANFDSHNFQLDAIWLDIDYTDGFKYFTWNPDTFSDPVEMQNVLNGTNKKLVTIIDPHIKVEEGYNVYDGALAKDLFVKNADGSVFQGSCWPGLSSYMDFLNPEARDFYGSMYSYENFQSTTATLAGIWNDMNEPSVFDNSLEMTLPADAIHHGNVKHQEIHNIYGFLHTMSTHKGLLERDNATKRPFILTRSHFAGSQRFAAIWTGDNTADWPYLLAEVQECLNSNILGIVLCGSDVGGFFNNPSNELYERWYQLGAWLPFFRAHSTKDAERREPYLKPEDTQGVVRTALQTRYKHLPVWYTLAFEHTITGDPIVRPLFYQYPEDVSVYKIDDQLLLGRDILVRAVAEAGVESVDVYFPGGGNEVWVSETSDDVQAGNGKVAIPVTRENIPVYYRRGGIVVRKDTVRSNTAEMASDSFTIYYTVDENNTAHGTLYIDDGVSFKYRDENDYTYVNIEVSGDNVTISNIQGDGNYPVIIEKIVRRDIVQMPEGSQSGRYKEIVHTTDASGQLLKNVKIDPKNKTVLRLK